VKQPVAGPECCTTILLVCCRALVLGAAPVPHAEEKDSLFAQLQVGGWGGGTWAARQVQHRFLWS
jgi:hypothetical protein